MERFFSQITQAFYIEGTEAFLGKPSDSLEINETEHSTMLASVNSGNFYTHNGSEFVENTPVVYWLADGSKHKTSYSQQTVPPEGSTTMPNNALEVCKREKKIRLRENVDAVKNQITSDYSQGEQDTWSQQVDEAKAYQADNNISDSEIPFLVAAIAADPSKTKALLSTAILNNDSQFRAASGNIIGQRMVKDALIEAAASSEELEAVDITITAPEVILTDK